MPDWTALNAWMAACWKLSWNEDPLPFSVPLRLEEPPPDVAVPLLVEPPLGAELLLDEEQAPSVNANATTATPAAAACFLYLSRISCTPFPAATSAASDGRSACKPWCASTVWPGRRYLRANGKWTEGIQQVKFWCLSSWPGITQSGTGGRRLSSATGMQFFAPEHPCPGLTAADLAVSARPPARTTRAAGPADPVRGHHASREEAAPAAARQDRRSVT